jgi:hypothetical protein
MVLADAIAVVEQAQHFSGGHGSIRNPEYLLSSG